MHTSPPRAMPDAAFPFLTDLHRALHGRAQVSPQVLDAVGLLTATADPDRAGRLRPGPTEPAALVERLAVWALRQVDEDSVVLAHALLLGAVGPAGEVTTPSAVLECCGC
jgi:hypothetical protein